MDIVNVTQKVREDFESGVISPTQLQELYLQYNAVADIEHFISQAIEGFPKLNCGVASVYLRYVFGAGALIQGKYLGHDHTFLLLNREVVIDITADQYGGPAIYVGPLIEPWSMQ
jgi:hypothetical protein